MAMRLAAAAQARPRPAMVRVNAPTLLSSMKLDEARNGADRCVAALQFPGLDHQATINGVTAVALH